MKTVIRRWGTGLGVRIPKDIADDWGLSVGTRVEVALDKGRLAVRPVRFKKYTLASLLSKVKRTNLHGEWNTGAARGRERI